MPNRENHAKGLNILGSRYVLAVKNKGTPTGFRKARLVVQAIRRRDKDYESLFTYAPTVTKASKRILLTVAASMGTGLGTRDESQAYICTTHALLRRVFVVPPAEAEAEEDELWEVLRPLYGIPESGAMRYSTYSKYHREKLAMRPTRIDPAVFVRHDDKGRLKGLTVLQVDDRLIRGTKEFLDDEEQKSVAFPSKGRTKISTDSVDFNGSSLKGLEMVFVCTIGNIWPQS
jgi:Reverse transcriptase (RNA-dependent DNA polymerase)